MNNPASARDVDVEIDVENAALGEPLRAMAAMVEARGGYLAPRLRLVERDGALRVERPRSAPPTDLLVAIPPELLVPIDGLVWSDDTRALRLAQPANHLSSARKTMLDLFLAIYNASGKLAQIAEYPAAVFARDPGLLEIVRQVKPETRPNRASLCELFLSTRQVFEQLHPADDAKTAVIMPVMDFLNHHHQGDTFRIVNGRLAIPEHHFGDSAECVSSYGGQRDPFDLLIGHGYVDCATPFAASLPVTLALPGLGTLVIEGRNLGANHAVNPPRISFAPKEVRLSHAVFDRRAPAPVLAVLSLPVRALAQREGASQPALNRALAELPVRLLEANRATLAQFRSALSAHRESPATAAQFLAASDLHEDNLTAALG